MGYDFISPSLLLEVDIVTLCRRDCAEVKPTGLVPDTAAHDEKRLPGSNPFPGQSLRCFTNCTAAKSYGYLLSLGILMM